VDEFAIALGSYYSRAMDKILFSSKDRFRKTRCLSPPPPQTTTLFKLNMTAIYKLELSTTGRAFRISWNTALKLLVRPAPRFMMSKSSTFRCQHGIQGRSGLTK
jgi:hypothetical protein